MTKLSNKCRIFLNTLLLSLTINLIGCDFSSVIQKEIIEAQSYISTQNYERAVKIYENILKKNPKGEIKIKVFYQLGELYSIHLGNWNKALLYFSKIQSESNDPRWLIETQEKMAEIYFSYLKDYKKSIEHYKALVNFVPKLEKRDLYKYLLAQSYLGDNDIVSAKALFKEISEDVGNDYYKESFFYLGLCSFREKEWQSSIDFWTEYLKREDKQEEIVKTKFLVANAYETMEKLREAYNIYYSLLGHYPNQDVIKKPIKICFS